MFFGISLKGDHRMYYLLLAVDRLLYVIGKRIVESRIGRSFVAIRENEIVAQCNGINIACTKALVFALSRVLRGHRWRAVRGDARLHRSRRLRHCCSSCCTSRSW